MALRKPLVLGTDSTTGNVLQQQLQPGDDVDLPIATQVELDRIKINLLSQVLVENGFILPDELTQDLE